MSFPPGFLSDENSSYACFSYICVPQNQYFARERIVETIQQCFFKSVTGLQEIPITRDNAKIPDTVLVTNATFIIDHPM
jgi:hypothetical protein